MWTWNIKTLLTDQPISIQAKVLKQIILKSIKVNLTKFLVAYSLDLTFVSNPVTH